MASDRPGNQPDRRAPPERVAPRRPRRQFTTRTNLTTTPMSSQDFHTAEEILARLVARAYAADHPEFFHRRAESEAGQKNGAGFHLTI